MRARCWLDADNNSELKTTRPKTKLRESFLRGMLCRAACALNNYLMQLDLSHLTIKCRPFIMQTMRLFIYPTHTHPLRAGLQGEKVAGVGWMCARRSKSVDALERDCLCFVVLFMFASAAAATLSSCARPVRNKDSSRTLMLSWISNRGARRLCWAKN